MSAQQAIDKKKLRVKWSAADLPAKPPREALLDGIYAALRRQHRAPEISQDERIDVSSVTAEGDTVRVLLRYVFDNDFASQYDEREQYDVEIVLDAAGGLVEIARWTSLEAS